MNGRIESFLPLPRIFLVHRGEECDKLAPFGQKDGKMDDVVALSITEVEVAGERVKGATGAAMDALVALDSSYDEWVTLQKALQILTRRSASPFVPNIPAHPLIAVLEEWQRRLGLNGAKAEQMANKTREKAPTAPPPPPVPTKIGIIFEAMMAVPLEKFKTDDIFKAVPADVPIPITRDDIYRAVPKLMNKEKMWRDREGFYHKGAPPKDGEARDYALINNDEEPSERMLLAG